MFFETYLLVAFLVSLLAAVYFFFEHRNQKIHNHQQNREFQRKLFELTLMSEVSDKIGYSISSRDVAATIALTAEKLFKVSTVSYALMESDHIEFVTAVQERISNQYISNVKERTFASLYTINPELKKLPIIEKNDFSKMPAATPVSNLHFTEPESVPLSYFHVPLVINNRITGIITLTSKVAHAFSDEEMSMMYKIVNRAQQAVGRLENVVQTEKGKVESLVKSLNSGEVFFTYENGSLNLFTINSAAIRFLKIKEENPQIIHVLAGFNLKPNIVGEMKQVILMKKSTIYRNVNINNLRFNIYVTPVFAYESDRIIGVALTMQDVTRENEIQKIREAFTNMMVHELRAPLTAIKGAADLLQNPNTQEEDKVKMRLVIKSSSERLLDEVNDMLDSAKINAGKLAIEKLTANINDAVTKATEEISYTAQSRGISIENHLDTTIPAFDFDPARIGQVVINMISNAIKYGAERTTIQIFTRNKGNMAEVEVRNAGQGIPEDKIKTLFKPFVQAYMAGQKAKGTGLGLYISKAIITQHNGEMWITSIEGKSTSVFFTIPIAHTVVAEPQAQAKLVN